MKHNDKMESLKEWEDTAVKQEFKYPMWFKSKKTNIIVRFDSFNKGEVVYVSKEESFYKTGMTLGFIPHTDTTIWKQVENPSLATDKEIEQVINEEYEKDSSINKDKQDMINPSHYKKGGIEAIDYMKAKSTPEEFKGHLRLTALKYLSRYGQKDDELQELLKCHWYILRLISVHYENLNEKDKNEFNRNNKKILQLL